MRTSGLLFNQHSDGSVTLGYEDYGVDTFGGSDYEFNYKLDQDNFKRMWEHLEKTDDLDIRASLVNTFGENFDTKKFEKFCQKNNIIYERYVHIS